MAPRSVITVLVVVLAVGLVAAQEVTLPLDRYEQLRSRANPTPTPTPAPPVPAALEEAQLEVEVSADSARLVQQLTLTLYSGGWQEVPLAATGSLVAADLGGLEGRVAADESWSLTIRGQGRHALRLESLAMVMGDQSLTRPTWALDVALPRAAVVGGVVRAAVEAEEVEILSGGVLRGRDERGGWRFVGKPGATLRVLLYGRAQVPERSTLPLRFTASTATRSVLTRSRRTVTGWLDVQVVQGALEQLRVPIPAGLEVVSLGGDPVAGWDVTAQSLVVTPLAPVEARLTVTVFLTGESTEDMASPVLVPADAQRVRCLTVLVVEGDGLAELATPELGRLAEPSERAGVPAEITQGNAYVLVVPDPGRPPRWSLTWPAASEVLSAQVDRLLVDVLVGEAGQAAYQVWAEVRSSGATDLTVALPDGFQLTSAGRDSTTLSPGVSARGLVVPLTAGDARQVVHLAGLAPLALPTGDGALTVPMPALSAPASRVEVRVLLPGGRRYELRPESRRGSVSGPPRVGSSAGARGSKLAAQTGAAPATGVAYGPQLLARPAGFVSVEAAWSALSSTPDPLTVEVKALAGKEEWF